MSGFGTRLRVLFAVQGEGRGHMTQALALAAMLRRRGHAVVGAVVGTDRWGDVPKFFRRGLGAPVEALPHLERALVLRPTDEDGSTELRANQFALARALWDAPADAGRDRERALALAELAAAGYEAASAELAGELAAIREWQASHEL